MKAYKAELVAVILALLSLVVAGFSGYSHNDKDLTSRIVKVETRQDGMDRSLDRVESKLDEVNRKVDRLMELMIGGKK